MSVKFLEIRDKATFLPCFAISTYPENMESRWLLRRAGYNCDDGLVIFGRLHGGPAQHDPYDWNDRTMKTAHNYIMKNYHKLKDGDVIDVEFILGETDKPKISEKVEFYSATSASQGGGE